MTEHEETQKQEPNKPIAKYQMNSVHGSLWRNQHEKGEFYTLSLERRFQKDGEWQTSHSFRADQIPALMEILTAAQELVREEVQKRGNGKENVQETERGLRITR
jgi:hypothetical protein